MPPLFWLSFVVMMLVGAVASLRWWSLFDQVGGPSAADADLDRLVRESW